MNALQLENLTTSHRSFWDVLGHICTARAHKLLFRASDQNSDIAVRFSDPDFI